MSKFVINKECYELYGNDLDGCSRQENEGCKGCILCVEIPDKENETTN